MWRSYPVGPNVKDETRAGELLLASMILCDVILTETKEARGVIVKDVTLLLCCQKVCGLDRFNSNFNGSRPNHLI